jgi:hypothetical protein
VLNYQGVPLAADQGLVKWTAVAGGIFTTKYLITEHAVQPSGSYLEKLIGPAVGPENTKGGILDRNDFTEIIKGLAPYAVDLFGPQKLPVLFIGLNRLILFWTVVLSIHPGPDNGGAARLQLPLERNDCGSSKGTAAIRVFIPHGRTAVLTNNRQVIDRFSW